LILAMSAASLVAGCARPGSGLRLEQPGLTGPQQRLDLVTEQLYWSGEGPVYRLLAEVPLPGAGTGRPAFMLYLRVTADARGKGAELSPVEVRGFLIQTRGAQAGLTPVVEAGVGGERPSGKNWKLDVDLKFEDSSRLSGELTARRADWKLTHFETRGHTADVQGLMKEPLPKLNPLPRK
jgi:hypothetical protein